jgi:UDP-N-acetylenolpyruvoylglucosamine reductase
MTPLVPHFLQRDFDISFLSTFRTQAKARYYFEILTLDDIECLPELYAYAHEWNIPIATIGGGTNCLFAFDLYEGILIRNRYTGYTEPHKEGERTTMRVHSGELSTALAIKLYQNYTLSTLIPWVGLPGTLGGACVGNA